jgi:hypothetical protein
MVSLSLHVVLLLALAIWTVRHNVVERLRLELAFGPAQGEAGQAEVVDAADEPAVVEIEKPDGEPPAMSAEVASLPAVAPPEPQPAPDAMESVADQSGGRSEAVEMIAIGTSLSGRTGMSKERLLGEAGGNEATETAVALALEWLVRQQQKDGLWSLQRPYADGSAQENRLAASAMALLALQGAGNTTREGKYREAVAKCWKALGRGQTAEGTFDVGPMLDQHAMYAHAQATIAACEAYGISKDPALEEPARKAIAYALGAQMPDGGWRYHPPGPNQDNRGDMSVSGWYLMALKSGEMAGLDVPAAAYENLRRFLDAVFVSDAKGFGYQISPNQKFFEFRPALTAEGLLCRQYLGWRRDDPRLVSGVELLLREAPIDFDYRKKNVYAWYYATQVCHHMGGSAWKRWNARMQELLLPAQVQTGRDKGSWDPANDQWGHVGGRLFMTSLCTCMLEVYYRHLPLYALQ